MTRPSLLLTLALLAIGCGSGSTAASGDGGPPRDAGADRGLEGGAAPAAATCGTTMTTHGPVNGEKSQTTCAYEGIPYAAPPTGDQRWKPTQPPPAWTTPRPSAPGSGCPQVASDFGTASTDEDCLFLNVWTPPPLHSSPLEWGAPRPTMVFVHGGAFDFGSGTFGLYTGNIVVTLNYRLGPFSFLSNAALRGEDAHGSAGNYGILDQIAAFEWVHDNIAAFGGDPSNVTIFGESAGGTSMFVHLASPLSKGLFSHVMIESGWAPLGYAALPQATADSQGATFATAVGCTDAGTLLSCMRAKSAADVLSVVYSGSSLDPTSIVTWFPVIDGYAIPVDPIHAIVSGSFSKVPTLLGNNADEGRLFLFLDPPTSQSEYLAYEEAQYPGHGSAIVAEYPVSSYAGSYFDAASAVLTDSQFVCPARTVARAITATGTANWRYDFTHAIDFIVGGLGAFHGSELLFVFGNSLDGSRLQPDELPLSKAMMGYWGTMASSGNPNGAGRFAWPNYQMSTEPEIDLDLMESTVTELESSQCDFWDSITTL
jgi:para-nitrobenzyl esterase